MRRLTLAALLAAAPAAPAQPDARPTAFLSTREAGGTYAGRERAVGLRPNAELPFYAYVVNPTDNPVPGAVTVVLAEDPAGTRPVAKGTLAGLPGSATARVPLALVAPPAPAKPGDPPPGVGVPATLYLLTRSEGEDKKPLDATPERLDVAVTPPANYLDADAQPTVREVGGGVYELTLVLKDRMAEADGKPAPFRGPPAKVRLDIRPALLPTLDPDAPRAGTYETAVPPGGSAALTARLRFRGKPEGKFAVGIDGYERARVYDIGPEGNNATPDGGSFARLDLPRYAVPGKPLAARLEVFRMPLETKPDLKFRRAAAGDPQTLTVAPDGKPLTTILDVATRLRAGPGGELVATAAVKDWVIPVDTAGVYGERTFALATDPPLGDPPAEAVVTFDDTPPTVEWVGLPAGKTVGTRLRVVASVTDAESPVTDVLFYLGEPPLPDGKLPPGTEAARGVLLAGPQAGRYAADFLLPETKGRVRVGVRATNAAGLTTTAEPATVLATDPPKPKEPRTVGDIRVRVIQGSTPERPQPGLPVELRTAAGAVVDARTTDDKGEATFTDLKPGGYVVSAVKLADAGAKAYSAASVTADKRTDVTLEVKR